MNDLAAFDAETRPGGYLTFGSKMGHGSPSPPAAETKPDYAR